MARADGRITGMDNANLRVTIRGMLVATAWAAVLFWACLTPLPGPEASNPRSFLLICVRAISLFTALAAPFEKAKYGMAVGALIVAIWVALSWLLAITVA